MRRLLVCSLSLMLVTLFAGCSKDSHEKVAQDMVVNMTQLRDLLKSVTDMNTSQAAVKKIPLLEENMLRFQERYNTLGKPPKELGDDLNAKYKPQLLTLGQEVSAELMRIHGLGTEISLPIEQAMKNTVGKQ